ncbi:hypothetical protein O53_294 [Microcystis aeruginosa TAIHU98]|uniref:Uncharacterized protein n=1 Tax=Microcystis aeruginosa TAIHU98 TaxID=1134457 RepID=L7E9Y5_MICAE|nr:hypothetical protein O53_294 [Microcystis aeruginosa TAIHU98]
MCPLCLCGSFHPLALEKCILEYILPTKAGRAEKFTKLFLDRKIPLSLSVNYFLIILIDEQGNWNFEL